MRYCWVAISWAVMAVTEFATWLVGVTIPVGLTTVGAVFGMPCCGVTGFSAGFCCVGLAAACRDFGFCAAGGCVVSGFLDGLTSTGGSRSGEADCWACAAGIAKGESGITTVDASHRRRRTLALTMERMDRPRYDVSGTSQRTKSHPAVPQPSEANACTPRPASSRVTTYDGRSPGSRVVTFRRLPGTEIPSGM